MIERIKICIRRWFEVIFKINNVEKLQEKQRKMQHTLDRVLDNKNELKAVIKKDQENLRAVKENIRKLNIANADYDKQGNNEKVLQGFELVKKCNKEKERLERVIPANQKLVDTIDKQIKVYKGKISQISDNIDELKAKETFSENVEKFNKDMKALDCGNIKDIVSDIDKNFYKAEYDLDDMIKDDVDIDSFVKNEDQELDDYLKSIRKPKGRKKVSNNGGEITN